MIALLGLSPWVIALAILIVFAGSATQASIGVGLGLMAAPTLSLMDEAFIPGAIVLVNLPLTVGMAARELRHVDWGILRAIPARLVGSVIGVWVVATSDQQAISIVIGCAVLLAVIASLTRLRLSPTLRNQLIAGGAAGFSGTVSGIGGPPMAITYQHSNPGVLRASLATFNAASLALFTIPLLAIAGVTGWREIRIAALLIPSVFAGLWVGKHGIDRLQPTAVRGFVLAVCAASAIVLLARQIA